MDRKGQLLKTGHKETPDLTIKRKKYKMDLIPPALVVARYFAAEQANVEDLQATREAAARELDEFVEEHTSSGVGEEGLVIDATNEKGNVTKRGVVARLRTIQEEAAPDSDEERDALMRCLVLLEAESNAIAAVKEAQASLDQTVLAHYATLAKTRIKALVVEDKWFASIRTAIEGEVQRLTHGTGKLVSTTALPSLSGKEIDAISIPIPPPEEQEAIVEALSDVDGSIAALEKRLDKTLAVKQGMMQQLLTGRVRLV